MVKSKAERKFTYPVQLRGDQLDWMDAHQDFHISQFVRVKLDEYIKLKSEVEKLEAA